MDLKANPLTDSPAGIALGKAQVAGVLLNDLSGQLMAGVMMPRQVLPGLLPNIQRARDAAEAAKAALDDLLQAMEEG